MTRAITNKLPKGWEFTTVGDFLDIHNGKRKPISLTARAVRKGQFPYYGATGIIDYLDDYTHEGEYILIGEDGANLLSKSKPLAFLADGKYWVNNHAHTAKCPFDCPNQYIEKYINSLSLRPWITGSAQPKLNKANLEKIPVPLAPLPEQKRIVEKLDSLLAQVDTIQQRLNNLPNIIKRFRQSVLAAAVSGKLTEQWRGDNACEEWSSVRLGVVVTPISQGWSPKCNNVPASNGDWGVIKTSAVQSINFVEQENKELPEHLEPREKLLVKKGDILVTRAGPRVRCGITCLVTDIKSNLMICDKVYRFQVKEEKGVNKFLVLQLNSLKYLEDIEKLKTGISDSGMNLTQKKFKELLLEWPSIEEQTEIVRLVEQYFALADTLEKNLANAKNRVDNLTQSILAKAFKGELVPQDPNDEPADKLLERIKAARLEVEALEKAAKKVAKAKTAKVSKTKPKAKGVS